MGRPSRVSEQVPGLDFEVAIHQHGRQFFRKHIEGQNPAQPQPGQTRSRQFKRAAAAAP